MTDNELRDEAMALLRKTTSKYSLALENNLSSNWGKAFQALKQIGAQVPPPPPPPDPVPAPSGYADFVGVCAYRAEDLPIIASVGIRHARWDNPSATLIGNARSLNIEILPLATYCPWADLNGGKSDKNPPLPQFYAEWSKRCVDRYRMMTAPPKQLEMYNEPWLSSFWLPSPDATAYLDLLKAFCAEVWAWQPATVVLFAADTFGSSSYPWRKNLLAADTTSFLADPRLQPTTHNYVEGRTPTQVTAQPCAWDLDRFKCAFNDLKAKYGVSKLIRVTEFGWTVNPTDNPPGVGETNQAAYVEQALRIFHDSGIVHSAYGFSFKSNDAWTYDWLDGTRQREVCARVAALVKT